jgi:hypothetical protein
VCAIDFLNAPVPMAVRQQSYLGAYASHDRILIPASSL